MHISPSFVNAKGMLHKEQGLFCINQMIWNIGCQN